MSKLKKVLLMCTAYVLVAVLAIGGTVAYLQDSDGYVNVMTLGNVQIEQIEQERDENGKLVEFSQEKPAYPVVGNIAWDDQLLDVNGTGYKVFDDGLKNVVDKIVTVNNTGKTDAYVRTIVAIEAPEGDPNDLIHFNWNDTGVELEGGFITQIDGVDYYVMTFVYTEALAAGEKSAPSLMQVFLDSKTTNEDCAKFGESWDILVKSQAVQADGFADAKTALDTAFGKITPDNHPFPLIIYIKTNNEAKFLSALETDAKVIILTDIVDVTKSEFDGKGEEVTLAGYGEGCYGYLSFTPGLGNPAEVKNLNVTGSGFVEIGHTNQKSKANIYVAENLSIKDMTATLCLPNGGKNIAAAFAHYGTATLKNCVMTGTVAAKDGYTNYDASFVNGTDTTIEGGEYGRIYIANQAAITIKGAKVGLIEGNPQGIVSKNTGAKLEIQNGAEVDKIVISTYNKRLTLGNTFIIRSGAVVDTLELTMKGGASKNVLNIEDGATINHLIIDGVEVNYNTWKNS